MDHEGSENENETAEDTPLQALRREQARLREQLESLEHSPLLKEHLARIASFREGLETLEKRLDDVERGVPAAAEKKALAKPEAVTETKAAPAPGSAPEPELVSPKTPAMPPPQEAAPASAPAPKRERKRKPAMEPTVPSLPAPVAGRKTGATDDGDDGDDRAGFEFQLGSFWLGRIGIVMVLTGLVFFAHLARGYFFSDAFGPSGRVAVLYAASLALLGAGLWLERGRETLRNYARVIIAGGLAAVYFTTYAAHYVDAMRVISNPWVGGILLLGWAGFMMGFADRRQSQTLALLGVLLAYWTSLASQVTAFSLVSALVLAAAAIAFMVKNRWATIGFAGLAGSYAAFLYWRVFHGGGEGFWPGYGALIAYWIVFAVGAFVPRNEAFAPGQRLAFAGLNNSAFLFLFGLGVFRHHPDRLWLFLLAFGAVLLGLWMYLLERRGEAGPEGRRLTDMHLAKGLVLVTAGLMTWLSGPSLALALAAEGAALLVLGTVMGGNRLLIFGGYASAALSVGYTLLAESAGPIAFQFFDVSDGLSPYAALGQALFLLGAAWWMRRRGTTAGGETLKPAAFSPAALALVAGALLALGFGAFDDIGDAYVPFAFVAVGGLAALAAISRGFLPELAVLGQFFPAIGIAAFLFRLIATGHSAWWPDVAVLAGWLALEGWARRNRVFDELPLWRKCYSMVLSAGFTAGLFAWISAQFNLGDQWLWLGGMLALAQFAYGMAVRSLFLTAFSVFYHAAAVGAQFSELPYEALIHAPLVLLVGQIFALEQALRRPALNYAHETRRREGWAFAGLLVMDALAIVSLWLWIERFVTTPWEPALYLVIGGAVLVLGRRWRVDHRIVAGTVLVAGGIVSLAVALLDAGRGFSLVPLVVASAGLLGLQQLVRRLPAIEKAWPGASGRFEGAGPFSDAFRERATKAMPWVLLLAGTAGLWRLVSVETAKQFEAGSILLTASWALLALVIFGLGLALKERSYRLVSLALLAAAVGRVVVIDVWTIQEEIARVLTFIVIGLVLLAVGFVYNRYQEVLRRFF